MPNGFTRQNFSQKNLVGFTLLELLIVIGILAILSTTMIMVINPAEMLRRARDSQRISDLNTLKSAIALYLTDVSNPNIGTPTYSYTHMTTGTVNCYTTSSATTSQAITGTGWIPIKFSDISAGSPIEKEPIDPNPVYGGASNRFYVYTPFSDNTFELAANMESTAYSSGGSSDVESKDGGYTTSAYEIGTKLSSTTLNVAGCFGTNP